MKYLYSIIIICFLSPLLSGQCTIDKWCLRFENAAVVSGGTHFEFDLVLSTDSEFGLGSSNIQFKFNNLALNNPTVVSTILEPPTYQPVTITTPFVPNLGQKVGSFNIELNSMGTGSTILVAGTTIGRISFEIIDMAQMSELSWYYNGGTAQTVIFQDDEATLLCALMNDAVCLQPSSQILPLDLLSFEAKAEDEYITLNWESQNEQNFFGYGLERSESTYNDFKQIDFLPSKINSSNPKYTYIDRNVTKGKLYYYRLKLIDVDGKFKYSKIQSARLNPNEILVAVYPNPIFINEILNISINNEDKFQFVLYDGSGKILLSKSIHNNDKIFLEDLNAGMYFYSIENETFAKKGKLTIVK